MITQHFDPSPGIQAPACITVFTGFALHGQGPVVACITTWQSDIRSSSTSTSIQHGRQHSGIMQE
jgi:hypothetical protein